MAHLIVDMKVTLEV